MTPEVQDRIRQISAGNIPKGYKRGKLGIVPEDWEEVPFSTLFTSTSDYTDDLEKYPLYSLTIEDGITAKTERYERSHLVKKENSYKIVRPNDFAYNPMNIRFGAVARHKGERPVAVSGYYDIFTTVNPDDLTFFESFLTCDSMITFYNKMSTGSLIEKQRVHFSDFLNFTLPLPPFMERRRIARILFKQDEIIKLKKSQLEKIEQQNAFLVQHLLAASQGNDTSCCSNYIKLAEVCDINPQTNVTGNDAVFISMADVNEVGEIIHQEQYIPQTSNSGFAVFKKNDILVAKITPCFENGKGAYTQNLKAEFGYGSTEFHVLRAKPNILPEYLFLLTQSGEFRKRLSLEMVGSAGQRRVQATSIGRYQLYLPSLKKQAEIVQILLCANHEMELIRQSIAQEQVKKKAMVQLLLTGIVRV